MAVKKTDSRIDTMSGKEAAEQMEYQHGGDVYTYEGMIDFSVNINPLGPGSSVIQAARNAVERMTQYPDAGCRCLRRVLAEALQMDENFFIFGNGGAELIFNLTAAERPKKAVLLAPSFAEYRQALQAAGCEIIWYPLKESEEFELGEAYLEYLKEDVDMIFLCSPGNPVGNIIRMELLSKILECCRKRQIRMVMDECFYEFLDSWQEHTLQQKAAEYPNLFILRAFTKMYAMPGLRLGYGICSDAGLIRKMEGMRQPWSVSVVAQEAGAAAVGDVLHPVRTREYIRRERNWLVGQLDEIGVRYFTPAANYIFVRSEFDLCEELKKCGILIRDCSNYEGLGKGYYRFAVKKRQENQRLVEELRRIYGI